MRRIGQSIALAVAAGGVGLGLSTAVCAVAQADTGSGGQSVHGVGHGKRGATDARRTVSPAVRGAVGAARRISVARSAPALVRGPVASPAAGVKASVQWPSLPVDVAPVQAVLEAAVRQIQRTVFNGSPVVKAGKPVTESNGDVTGTVIATDPEGDPLSYKVVGGPSGGTVTVNPDGSYSYTPSAAHQVTGGVDSFVVAVTDTGRHLHLFQGNGTTRITVSVFTEGNGEDPGNLGATRGFNVYNLSGEPLTFDHYDGDKPAEAPRPGTVIQPGQYAHFELTYYLAAQDEVRAWFAKPGDWYAAQMKVGAVYGDSLVKCGASSGGTCGPTDWTYASTIRLFDLPGTVIEIGPDNPDEQTKVLESLCGDAKPGTCAFKATGETQTYTVPTTPYGSYSNRTDQQQRWEVTVKVVETHTNSLAVGAKLSVKLISIINAELNATYTHTWTRTETVQQTYKITVKPDAKVTLTVREPMFRDFGDFTVQLGNTTWLIRGVYFDSPDPNRGLDVGAEESELSDSSHVSAVTDDKTTVAQPVRLVGV
ncbi:Ig-like domain-containing protein [Mycobacterium sp. shizuoka-1]|uniref:Ig-like domain-containing protein n=1 Tax=Mycobacterium sp. shizuoka-1 TaxID=2039281 RepID=UPI000C05D0C7|nr:Ig-like domain-containing protein [Mycobacterium sp. shizuoka-1]GAY16200.1 hypothetical protein MSZK_29260 [Mycobacterium sp. shizuoka-1]